MNDLYWSWILCDDISSTCRPIIISRTYGAMKLLGAPKTYEGHEEIKLHRKEPSPSESVNRGRTEMSKGFK